MLQEFNGRVYATGNPQACFELGTGQTEISLRIPIGTQCGSVQSVGGAANISSVFLAKIIQIRVSSFVYLKSVKCNRLFVSDTIMDCQLSKSLRRLSESCNVQQCCNDKCGDLV